MKKIVLISVSFLLLFTQCRKDDTDFNVEETVPVRLEIPLDKSTRSDFSKLFPSGKVNWGNYNGIEYVYLVVPYALEFCDVSMGYYTQHLGVMFEMKAEVNGSMDKLIFEGRVLTNALSRKDNCMMYYFGNNGQGEEGTNVTTYYKQLSDKNIIGKKVTFDKQTGSIDKLGDYHLAKASVKVKKNVDGSGNPISYDLTIESFKSITSFALLDLEGVTKLDGSAVKLKSFTLKWTEDYVFEEIYEYDSLGYIDVSDNIGSKSFISLLPSEGSVSLECSKGKYEFVDGIKSNQVYVGKNGGALGWSEP